MSRLIGAVTLMIVTLLLCGAVIAMLIANYSYREPVYAYPDVDYYNPVVLPPVQGGGSHEAGPGMLHPEVIIGGNNYGYYPKPPADLTPVDEIQPSSASLYLLALGDLTVQEAAKLSDTSVEKLLELVREPGEASLQSGFVTPFQDKVQITPLGLSDATLYLLLTMDGGEAPGSYAEAAMLDALILTMTSLSSIERVQFVVDLRLGYQGRLDLSQPHTVNDLFSVR